jgi:hypothetical protein
MLALKRLDSIAPHAAPGKQANKDTIPCAIICKVKLTLVPLNPLHVKSVVEANL